jgi:phosphoribosylaminoimidazolecarboxamide formyltransferase/IMP cyclohydrolase
MLRARWNNLRLLEVGAIVPSVERELEFRNLPGAGGGVLVQERDAHLCPGSGYERKSGGVPSDETIRAARFLECVVRSLLSNAVCIGGVSGGTGSKTARLYGAGAGQMDRVTSCRLACEKAGKRAEGAIAFSDAFFPFPDGPRILVDAGVRTIVHPGGSKRDGETFELCERAGVTCLVTGVRHFRH